MTTEPDTIDTAELSPDDLEMPPAIHVGCLGTAKAIVHHPDLGFEVRLGVGEEYGIMCIIGDHPDLRIEVSGTIEEVEGRNGLTTGLVSICRPTTGQIAYAATDWAGFEG